MAVVKADGFRSRGARRRPDRVQHGATRLGVTSLEEVRPLRDAGLVAPVLSWLNPWTPTSRRGRPPDRPRGARHPAPGSDRLVPGRARGTCTSTPAWHATGPSRRPGGSCAARPVVPELRGRGRGGGRRRGHLGCADDPTDSCNAWPVPVSRGPWRPTRRGLRPRHRHPGRDGCDPHRPRTHHDEPGRGGPGRDRPVAYHRAAPGDDAHRTLVSVRRVRAGTPVGYGHAHRTATATHLGLVPSAADGLPPGVPPGRGAGPRRPAAGRRAISMDQPRGRPRGQRGRGRRDRDRLRSGGAGEPTVASGPPGAAPSSTTS